MVLGGRPPGRVGRRRDFSTPPPHRSASRTPISGRARRFVASRTASVAACVRSDDGRPSRHDRRARRRRRRAPGDVESEILALGGRRGRYLLEQPHGGGRRVHPRSRHARRCASSDPCATPCPDAPSVRELTGLVQYQLGHYRAAAKELEAFVELTDSVEQHPVLMDCYRGAEALAKRRRDVAGARGRITRSELVTEGRIVVAGALADRGRHRRGDRAAAHAGRRR